eukprot:208065-Rhodomonas_salina.1
MGHTWVTHETCSRARIARDDACSVLQPRQHASVCLRERLCHAMRSCLCVRAVRCRDVAK